MNWFQRYGIPGAVFWGFLILWIGAFHHSVIPKTICSTDIEKAKIIAAIAAGTFLPIGYLLSVIGQLIYHLRKRFGMDTRARLEDPEIEDLYYSEREWQQEVVSVRQMIKYLDQKNKLDQNNKPLRVEDLRFVSEWMSKRMGMVVINLASILAVIAAPLLSLLLWLLLPLQFDLKWALFALFMLILVGIICEWSRRIFMRQLVRIERIILNLYNDPMCQNMEV